MICSIRLLVGLTSLALELCLRTATGLDIELFPLRASPAGQLIIQLSSHLVKLTRETLQCSNRARSFKQPQTTSIEEHPSAKE